MKKYLLIVSSTEIGGAERQAIRFASYLKDRGNPVTVLGFYKTGKVYELCEEECIKCEHIKIDWKIIPWVFKAINFFSRIGGRYIKWNGFVLAHYLRRSKADICISYCATANVLLGLSRSFYKGPKRIWYQRDAGIFDFGNKAEQYAIQQFDVILANSISGSQWIKKTYGKDSIIIPNGVVMDNPKNNREVWRKRLDVTENDILYIMVANLSSLKNHKILLEAWNEMKKMKEVDHKILAFAGRFDEQYESLSEYVRENELDEYIRFTGPVEDISGLLEACDICIFGAKSEGSPNGIIEAEMVGLPVIATDLPEIREVVPESSWCYLFNNVLGDIIVKVNTMFNNPELRKNVGEENKRFATEKYSPDLNFARIVEIAEKLK